jgi:Tfp pilus assembly protein FimV
MFKQFKDMKELISATPEMLETAQQISAQAEELAAAQNAMAAQQPMAPAASAPAPAAAPAGPGFEPIGGVSMELYVEISKALGAHGYDQSQAAAIAASKGVSPDRWQAALDGWNDRMRTNPAVAQRFNSLYTGR